MWGLLLAFWLGVIVGVGLMAIVSINRGEDSYPERAADDAEKTP